MNFALFPMSLWVEAAVTGLYSSGVTGEIFPGSCLIIRLYELQLFQKQVNEEEFVRAAGSILVLHGWEATAAAPIQRCLMQMKAHTEIKIEGAKSPQASCWERTLESIRSLF